MAENIKIENPSLVAAIKEMKENNTSDTRNTVMNEIMRAKFLVPAQPSAEPAGEGKERKFNLALMENKQTGDKHIPAFTDINEFAKLNVEPKPAVLVMDFDGIANALLAPKSGGTGIVFNPFGDSLVIDKKNVASLRMQRQQLKQNTATSAKQETVPPNTPISLGIPKEPPTAILNAVSAHLSAVPEVDKAYLRVMKQGDDVSLLIILDGTFIDGESIFKGVFSCLRPMLTPNSKINFVDANTEFGKKATENIEPFYQKPASEYLS